MFNFFKKEKELPIYSQVDKKKINYDPFIIYDQHILDVLHRLYEDKVVKATITWKEEDCLKMKHYYEVYREVASICEKLKKDNSLKNQ